MRSLRCGLSAEGPKAGLEVAPPTGAELFCLLFYMLISILILRCTHFLINIMKK